MTVHLGQCWSSIKARPNIDSFIHFSHLLLREDQVSLKFFLFLFLLLLGAFSSPPSMCLTCLMVG